MSGLVARRPKGTELTVRRWLERNASAKPAAFELRCISTAEPYVLERLQPRGTAETFAAEVIELAQEDADARGERSEYHLVALGDGGGAVVDDATPLATHVIRCLPREAPEPPNVGAADALRMVMDHQQALMKSFLSVSTAAMAEVQRISGTAIEATRGLVAPLAKRVAQLEAENENLREIAREAETVIAMAGASEEGELRQERRTASLEKLAALALGHFAKNGDVKLAGLVQELVGTPGAEAPKAAAPAAAAAAKPKAGAK